MNRRFVKRDYLLVAAFLLTTTALVYSQETSRGEPTDEEYRVYDAVLADKFTGGGTDFGSLSDGRRLVILKELIVGEKLTHQNYMWERLSPSDEASSNFNSVRTQVGKLGRKFRTSSDYVLLPQETLDSFFRKPDGLQEMEYDSWKKFYEAFPESKGYIAFSRAGFDKEKTNAVVYLQHSCGSACASGYFITLRKVAGSWSVERTVMIWVS